MHVPGRPCQELLYTRRNFLPLIFHQGISGWIKICVMEDHSLGKRVCFVTTNKNKVRELSSLIGIPVEGVSLELDEIQGTIEEIAIDKAKRAAQILRCPVLVEDSALCFNAFKALPGPYIRQFLEAVGCEGLVKLLIGFDDYGASAVCTFAFCEEPGKEVKLFEGKVEGKIVDPRGSRGFGWDPIFEPEGYGLTFGEMSDEVKNSMSHRAIAYRKLVEYISSRDLKLL